MWVDGDTDTDRRRPLMSKPRRSTIGDRPSLLASLDREIPVGFGVTFSAEPAMAAVRRVSGDPSSVLRESINLAGGQTQATLWPKRE